MLKPSNYLTTISLYRDHDKALAHRDGKNCAIPARHRDSFLARNRDNGPDGFAGNANSLNCRAVMLKLYCDLRDNSYPDNQRLSITAKSRILTV